MKNEYAQWRKLDNAALAFPAVTGKNDTRVFRFYCELKEEIKEEGDFVVDEKAKSVTLTQQGVEKAEKFFNIENLSDCLLYTSPSPRDCS